MIFPETDPHEAMLREAIGDLTPGVDLAGFEIVRLLRAVGNQYVQEAASTQSGAGMSGPRWHLLLRLYIEEQRGGSLGLPPSYLSRCQDVTKNTISVLLRGLEVHGWIERTLDLDDRRVFRIRLTPAGRELIRTTAPARLAHLNALVDELSAEERCGRGAGISPTHLSQRQNVSKNTISVLLRGLEEQGLIERTLVPDDRRAFQIRLTDAGRTLVETTAPAHIAFLNAVAAGLTADESAQLIELLQKLHRSLSSGASKQLSVVSCQSSDS